MNLRSAFLFTIIISILASCTKIESTDIGAGLIPPVDNINTFDVSLDAVTQNLLDTGLVFPLSSDQLVLGRVSNDPLFGKSTGILNLELKPEVFPFRFLGKYDSLKLDSIVLVLGYQGVWGDTMTTQKLNVYEVSLGNPNPLRPDSLYSTREHIKHEPTVLGSATVDPRNMLADSILPNKEPVNKNQIRIRLTNTAFQQKIFQDQLMLDSNVAYKQKFAGLAIEPDTTTGFPNSLLVVSLSDTNTKMAIYYSYRIVDSPSRKSTVDYFRYTAVCGFSNQVIRNPVGAQYQQYLSAGADSLIYLQTRPDAPYAKIKIPGLDTFSNKIIHRAELVITQVPNTATGDMDKYFTPPALFLTLFSADSSRKFMIPGGDVNFSLTGVSNFQDFGSYPFKRNISGQEITNYAFNLTHYVQGIVTKKNRNYDLVLSAPFADYIYASESFNTLVPIAGSSVLNPLALGRVRIGGGSLSKVGPNAQYRMRLRVIYTRI